MSELQFHPNTPEQVKRVLNSHRGYRHLRLRIWYGDQETGTAWLEENDVIGSIGASTGPSPIPLLIANARSSGGGAILDHCIVRIDQVGGGTLYRHPQFNNPADRAIIQTGPIMSLPAEVVIDGQVTARFKSHAAAQNWIAFMQGRRYAK